jgi:hypothetical protein
MQLIHFTLIVWHYTQTRGYQGENDISVFNTPMKSSNLFGCMSNNCVHENHGIGNSSMTPHNEDRNNHLINERSGLVRRRSRDLIDNDNNNSRSRFISNEYDRHENVDIPTGQWTHHQDSFVHKIISCFKRFHYDERSERSVLQYGSSCSVS